MSSSTQGAATSPTVGPNGAAPLFVIALFDDHDPEGTTVHTFTDPALWAWLTRAETFPAGADSIRVPIPGTSRSAWVSAAEPTTDKAQNLAWLPGGKGRCHPALTALDLGRSDTGSFADAYGRLVAQAGADHVVVGRW